MNELALFSGAGGGILGGKLLGWRTVCAVEIEPYPASILAQRQNDGVLPTFPIWDDIRSFRGESWRGLVDVVSGGFPCQDVAAAGTGLGLSGSRSGLWREMFRIVGEVRPPLVFAENSDLLVKRGLRRILQDFTEIGYDAVWTVLGASDLGAWHKRKRTWILAADNRSERVQGLLQSTVQRKCSIPWCQDVRGIEDFRSRPDIYSPQFCRASDGVAAYVDRIKSIGNGQVPIVAASAFSILAGQIIKEGLYTCS